MTRPLVRVVFALLVVATIAAFVATQQLKGEDPLVLRFSAKPLRFSPNGDGWRDGTRIGFDLSEPARVSFSVMDTEGHEVRRLVDDRELEGDTKHRFPWNGRDDEGARVPDGVYRMRVVRRDEGRVIDSAKEVVVDRVAPEVELTSARPGVIAPGEPGQSPEVRIRYRGPRNEAPVYRIFRTDEGEPRLVLRFRGGADGSATWDGRLREGRTAPVGDYAFTVQVRDRAGNPTEAPAAIPTPDLARPGTGVSVRRFTLEGPLAVVPAGAAARLEVGPFDRSFDFVLSRLGDPSPLVRGERIGGAFRVRVPRRTRTGLYVVRVRAGSRRAVWPLAVAGLPQTRRSAGRPRPLVVLPALSWQGLNRVDDDLDGFADSLPDARRVPLAREFAGGGLPPRLRSQSAPLLRFLDRSRLAYDLTTDLSLARREGPALGNAPGVAFAGSALWLPAELERRLRSYVEDGGRLASFGADAFRRRIRLAPDAMVGPARSRRTNAFGERTALTRTGAAPMSVFEDDPGLFDGLTGLVGEFTLFERSESLPTGARLLVSAGRDPAEPAFVAFRLGEGLMLRSGTPQWAGELAESRLSVEVPRVTERIWTLLSGRDALD
ncbi:MAG TPA: N,N-dimethylformamidase beta subunit family domain-containing protein [Thermoleophilaceae bacterium]|nr:N,N-dimethylformamidase beta subunit family domain-containing protein [Thermoleophilaceae bacterium]